MSSTGTVAEKRGGTRSDADLVARVRAGDDAAFEELYHRYNHRIRAFVHSRLRDRGRAEDVTQEAFLSALRRMRATDSPISFKPWLFEIARNAAIDVYRRTSRTEEVPVDEHALSGAPEPDVEVFTRERLELLSGAFAELPEVHHRALVMRELEGRSYREIGERLDLTRSAVESTLFRARRRLEHEYSELEAGRHCELARATMATIAEGLEPGTRRRRRFVRHTRRCLICRRHAVEMGVAPLPRFAGLRERAAALFPIPLLLRRASAEGAAGGAVAGSQVGSGLVERAASLLAAAAFAGAGGFAVHDLRGVDSHVRDASGLAAPAAQQVPAPERSRPGAARHGLPPATGTVRRPKTDRHPRAGRAARHDRFVHRPARRKAAGGTARPTLPSGGAAGGATGSIAPTQSHVLGAPAVTGSIVPTSIADEAVTGLSNGSAPVGQGVERAGSLVDGAGHRVNGLVDRTGKRLHAVTDGFR